MDEKDKEIVKQEQKKSEPVKIVDHERRIREVKEHNYAQPFTDTY